MNHKYLKACKGCKALTKLYGNIKCEYHDELKDEVREKCPCAKCIIKGVCNDECDTFDEFYQKNYNHDIFENDRGMDIAV